MKILLFQPGALGDSFFTSAMADIIKKHLPEAKVYFYTTAMTKEMVRDNPFIDDFIIHTGNIFKDVLKLRGERFDFVLDTWAVGDAYYRVFFIKAKNKLAIRKKESEKYLVPFIYTEQVPFKRHGYVFWDRLELLRPLNIQIDKYIGNELPVYHLSDYMKKKVKARLEKNGITDFVLFTPKGKWKTKDIPAGLTARTIDILQGDLGKKVVLSASPSDAHYIYEIARISKTEPYIFITPEIRELGSLIHFSKHLVSVESLPYHLAVGLRKSATVVLGGYPPWKPKNYEKLEIVNREMDCKFCSKKVCPQGDYACLNELTPEEIVETVVGYV